MLQRIVEGYEMINTKYGKSSVTGYLLLLFLRFRIIILSFFNITKKGICNRDTAR